jgi:nodulation protein F
MLPPEATVNLGMETRLDADLGLTSLDLTEVIFEIEDAFGVTLDFDASTASRFQTVRDIVAHVKELVVPKG